MDVVDAVRLKVWQALSDLFLDTEINDVTFDYISRVVLESNYSSQKIQNILWGEVFPVLESNLRSVAGEWAGWTDDWLQKHLTVYEGPARTKAAGRVGEEIARCWEQIAARLPPEFT